MEQAEKKQESPLEQASNLYSQYQNARFLGQVGRLGGRFAAQVGARAGMAAAGALGTIGAPFWIALGVILGFTFFIVLIGGQNLTGQTPTTEAGGVFTPGVVPTPASPTYEGLRVEIIDKLKVDFVGFDPNLHSDYLKWAREKLYHASTTQFVSLARGSAGKIIVQRADDPYSQFAGCNPPTIKISGLSSSTNKPYEESLYKVVFIHELSHLIHACNPSQSRLDELQDIINQESYLTAYSQSSLDCSITRTYNLTEDYAEMLAYFLNREPEIGEASADFGYWKRDAKCLQPRTTQNPYQTGKFPLHQKLAAEILGVVTPTSTSTLAKLSCLVDGGTISFPSYQENKKTGHCGEDYVKRAKELGYDESQYACNTGSRRAKSVDVLTDGGPNGKEVRLPFIDGKTLNWTRIEGVLRLSRTDCFPEEMLPDFNCGVGVAFTAKDETGNNWVLQLLHIYEPSLAIEVGQSHPSVTVVGKSEAIHTHVTIGKNVAGNQAFAIPGSSDTRSGWLAPDLEMGMCQ